MGRMYASRTLKLVVHTQRTLDYSVCGLSVQDRKLLTTNYKGATTHRRVLLNSNKITDRLREQQAST